MVIILAFLFLLWLVYTEHTSGGGLKKMGDLSRDENPNVPQSGEVEFLDESPGSYFQDVNYSDEMGLPVYNPLYSSDFNATLDAPVLDTVY